MQVGVMTQSIVSIPCAMPSVYPTVCDLSVCLSITHHSLLPDNRHPVFNTYSNCTKKNNIQEIVSNQ